MFSVKCKITDLIAAGLVVLDVAGELVEDDPDDEEDGDAGPASDEEPGHVGLGRTGGGLLLFLCQCLAGH